MHIWSSHAEPGFLKQNVILFYPPPIVIIKIWQSSGVFRSDMESELAFSVFSSFQEKSLRETEEKQPLLWNTLCTPAKQSQIASSWFFSVFKPDPYILFCFKTCFVYIDLSCKMEKKLLILKNLQSNCSNPICLVLYQFELHNPLCKPLLNFVQLESFFGIKIINNFIFILRFWTKNFILVCNPSIRLWNLVR